jgi:hypothetical protein
MMRVGARILAAVVVTAVVAACGATSTSPFPSPAAVTPSATSSPAASAPPPNSSAPPTPAAEPTGTPTSAALVLGGTWVSPKAGATLSSYTATLSARPTASGPGVTTFTEVVFSATRAGATKTVMCTVTKPGSGGAWTCKANLLALGVPPGKVTFSFDVRGEGVLTASSPDGPRKITYAVPPPRPTDADLTQIKPPDFENGDNTGTYRVDWSAPAGYADEFLVYYTEECPRPSTKTNAGTPCFVAGTPVDVSQLELLAKAPGDTRSIRVGIAESDCEGIYGSILLRARNAYGRSTFAIVHAAPVFWYDPDSNDTIC